MKKLHTRAIVSFAFLICLFATFPLLADEFGPRGKMTVDKPYFGQTPPGMVAQKFAPGIISTGEWMESGGTFSPDGSEFYFTRGGIWPDATPFMIYVSRYESREWTAPVIAEFCFSNEACLQPWMSFDGNTIFFSSRQPVDGVTEERTWAVQRQGDGWGEPAPVSAVVNGPSAFHLNMSRTGETFFSAGISPTESGIFSCTYKNGVFSNRYELGPPISSDYDDYHGFIAPDGSFLMFDSQRPGDAGERDLYVSFRRKGNEWTTPHPLTHALGAPDFAQIPTMAHDGKYLFFHADNDIYWVDIKAVRALGPTDLSVSKLKVKPKSALHGEEVTVKALMKNGAGIDSSDTAVELYLTANGKISKKAVLLKRIEVGILKAKGRKKLNEKITVPKNVKAGSYYFTVRFARDTINVDPNNANNEARTKKRVPVQ